ncbi:MAG: PilZ domain-containing protein [Syntrophobacterales bacterium]|jgi:Tfp pilus assembly protein PilZ
MKEKEIRKNVGQPVRKNDESPIGEEIKMVPETNSNSRAQVKWSVTMDTGEGVADGVIMNINNNGAFIRCHKPLRLSETCTLTIKSPDHAIEDVAAEVVWTNIHGPDDDLTPRGMGVRFTEISKDEEKYLRKLVRDDNSNMQKVPEVDLDETLAMAS